MIDGLDGMQYHSKYMHALSMEDKMAAGAFGCTI